MIADSNGKPRYIMIGGFLGAGKTTAVSRLGKYLVERGQRVGIISNDQSTGLVDTAVFRVAGFDVEEIAGGCFCCRFNSLVEAADKLTARSRPDVFLAEPVGSCTDLVATVSYPLRRIYGDDYAIAPLSVIVDPKRCAKVFGIVPGRSFSQKVIYVYRKQLEEANFIIVNKCDSIEDALREQLVETMSREFPAAKICCCSARDGEGVDAWFEQLLAADEPNAPSMELDYERYGEGEALLGWLNCTVQLQARQPVDGNRWLMELVNAIRTKLQQESCEIAHLKMMLEPVDANGQVAVVSLVGNDQPVELRESLLDGVTQGQLIINLRGEGDPTLLRDVTLEALEHRRAAGKCFSEIDVQHVEHFRPGKPSPMHRMATA